MKLTRISIENFKSINKLAFDVRKYGSSHTTMFVGINEVGKSNILEAMSFFDVPKNTVSFKDFNNRNNTSSSYVDLYFEMEFENSTSYLNELQKKFEFPNEEGKPYKSSGGEMVESELGEIPKGWEVKPLDVIADFLNGLALQKYPPTGNDDFPVIKIREMKQGINEGTDMANSEVPEEYVIKNGDVLFAWSGSLIIDIWCQGRGALNQHIFKVTSVKYSKWFYYYWTHYHLEKFIQIAADKTTTMGHIQRKHLSESYVLVPNSPILDKMNHIMESIINQMINCRIEILSLQRTRDSLLPKLMTGKIRVVA